MRGLWGSSPLLRWDPRRGQGCLGGFQTVTRGSSRNAAARVSVVIPVRDDCENCRNAVVSALAQSLAPTEVIVVDDGSDPPLPPIHDDQRVRQFRLDAHRGPSAARNRGVAEAQGDWIAFLDADDLWRPDKLERQLAAWSGREGAVLACNVEVIGRGASRPFNRTVPPPELDRWILVEGGGFQTSGLVMPRAIALAFPFNKDLAVYEDWDLVLRLAEAGTHFDYVPHCLATYHVADGLKRADGNWLERRAAWLADPASPAKADTRYQHYLVEVARAHLRLHPAAALATLARLAWQTGRPFGATIGAVREAMRLRSERRRCDDQR